LVGFLISNALCSTLVNSGVGLIQIFQEWKDMKRDWRYFLCALATCVILFAGCSHLGSGRQLAACQLVTKADAESILKKTAYFDKKSTDEIPKVAKDPGVTDSCIYTSGEETASPRLVVGYQMYDDAEFLKAAFEDSKRTKWKDQEQELVEGAGDEAFLVEGRMIVYARSSAS
jgi:hypothetical protein